MRTQSLPTEEFLKGKTPRRNVRGMIPPLNGRERYTGMSSASYYNERFALAMLPNLVDMIKTGEDKEFLKDQWCTVETVYQRVQQSIAYCMDKLDEGGVLEELRKKILLRKTDRGVVVCFAENADRYSKQRLLYRAHVKDDAFIVRNAISVNWRLKLNEFIENLEQKSLRLTDGFALTPADIAETRALCELMPEGCEIIVKELTQTVIHLERK